MYIEISVKDLIHSLLELRLDDILFPNEVGNLAVVRDGVIIGVIHLRQNMKAQDRVEMFQEEDSE